MLLWIVLRGKGVEKLIDGFGLKPIILNTANHGLKAMAIKKMSYPH
jgi:hypothetical protein